MSDTKLKAALTRIGAYATAQLDGISGPGDYAYIVLVVPTGVDRARGMATATVPTEEMPRILREAADSYAEEAGGVQ